MKHMPYEETVPGDLRWDAPTEDQPYQEQSGRSDEESGPAPRQAEGSEVDTERRGSVGEPGRPPY
jgi:carboxylesterase type B